MTISTRDLGRLRMLSDVARARHPPRHVLVDGETLCWLLDQVDRLVQVRYYDEALNQEERVATGDDYGWVMQALGMTEDPK